MSLRSRLPVVLILSGIAVILFAYTPAGEPLRFWNAEERAFRSSCQDLPITDIYRSPRTHQGQRVKYTGKILVMDGSGGLDASPAGCILSVPEDPEALQLGQIPVYASFPDSAKAYVHDTVTIYGEVAGTYEYKTPVLRSKKLPWVSVRYIERH